MSELMAQHEAWVAACARMGTPREVPAPRIRAKRFSPFSRERALTANTYFVNLISPPSWRVIAKLVALKHGFRLEQLSGPERTRDFVAARDEAMKLLATHTEMSLPEIGRRFDRDHTSVLHSLRKSGIGPRQHGVEWTGAMDADLRRLWAEGVSLTDAAFVLDVSRNQVIARVIRLDLPTRSGKPRAGSEYRGKRKHRRTEALRA